MTNVTFISHKQTDGYPVIKIIILNSLYSKVFTQYWKNGTIIFQHKIR